MKKIDLEAHFYTQDYVNYLRSRKEAPREEPYEGVHRVWLEENVWLLHGLGFMDSLLDLGEGRLKIMDEAGIDVQVLSLSAPGCEQFSPADGAEQARKANDELSKVIKKYPDRFLGLAALPLQSPAEAADELERTVKEFGFKGAKVHSHVGATYLDDERYQVVFERAEKLDVPIYTHPTSPHPSMLKPYTDYGFALAGPALGFGVETALQSMRLIYSGIFDKYPGLKIILGHLGEGLTFWMDRIDFMFIKPWVSEELKPKINKKPSDYFKSNFITTTSGIFNVPAFLNVFMEIGIDNIVFAADYPYEKSEESVDFMEKVPISDIDKERVYHLNAEKLLKLS